MWKGEPERKQRVEGFVRRLCGHRPRHTLLPPPTSPACRDVSKPTKVLVTLGMLAFTVWILFNFCGDTILSRKRLESGMD